MLSILHAKVSSVKPRIILVLVLISLIGVNGFTPEHPRHKEFNTGKSDISRTDVFLDMNSLHECCASQRLRMEEADSSLQQAKQDLETAEDMLASCGLRNDCALWSAQVGLRRQNVETKQAAYNIAKAAYDECTKQHQPITFSADADGDGLGDKNNSRPGCSGRPLPEGYVSNNEDCDDSQAEVRRCGRCCVYLNNEGNEVKCLWSKSEGDCEKAAKESGGNAEYDFSNQTHCKIETCPSANRVASFLPSLNASYREEAPSVDLQWITPDLLEAKNFFIQRSRDGERFKTIGILKNNKITSDQSSHSFSDINPLNIGYYRVTWVSDGKLYNSQVVTVYTGSENQMQLAPNPANGSLRIYLRDMGLYVTEVTVFDATGRLVISKKLLANENELDVTSLIKGVYIIKATQGRKVFREKFYKE